MTKSSNLIQQWVDVRPETDVKGMLATSQAIRFREKLGEALSECHRKADLRGWEFDVLATLRRQPNDRRLTHKELTKMALVSASAMTQRVDRLVARGLVRRSENPLTRREVYIELTQRGFDLIEVVIDEHASICTQFIAPLTDGEYELFNQLMGKLLDGLE